MAYNIRYDLRKLLQKDVRHTLLTDSLSLFKVIINSTVTTEKRLMIDIAAVREAYERSDIDFIYWIPSQFNLANGLTKFEICPTLQSFLRSHQLYQEIAWCWNSSAILSTRDFADLTKLFGNNLGRSDDKLLICCN